MTTASADWAARAAASAVATGISNWVNSTSQLATAEGTGVRCALAPGATSTVFSALASTTIIAVPLGPGTVTVLSSPTALARRWARSWAAAGSSPNAPENCTCAPARCGHRLVGALPAWRSGQRRRKHRLAGARKRVHHERQVHVHAAYHAHPGRHGADVSLTGVCHACCWLKSLVSLLSQGYQWVSCRWRVPVFEHACGSGRVVGMLDRLDAVGRWSECVVV